MSQFRRLSESVLASPQITLDDVATAAREGVTMIICNRPDDEDPDQLNSDAVRQAAQAQNIAFVSIPITHSGFSQPQIAAMVDSLQSAQGPVLAYCRSGTRSTLLWALARASQGADPETLANQALAAGYDVSTVRPAMDMLAAQHG